MRDSRLVKIVKRVIVSIVVVIVLVLCAVFGYTMIRDWHDEAQKQAVNEAVEKEQKKLEVIKKYNQALNYSQSFFEKIESKVVEEEYVFDAASLETEISDISELATIEYLYTNYGSVTSEKNFKTTGWKVPLSSKELIIVMKGSIKIGVDCSKIKLDVDENTKTITIDVPSAKILSNELFEDSLVVCVEDDNLFSDISTEDSALARQQIKTNAEDDVEASSLFEQAEEKAAIEVEHLLESIPEVCANYTIKIA